MSSCDGMLSQVTEVALLGSIAGAAKIEFCKPDFFSAGVPS